MTAPFRSYREFMVERYGAPLHRVPVDLGFGCPNRRPDGSGGCTFCAPNGGRAGFTAGAPDLEGQVRAGIAFARERYGAQRFMAYVQAFTGTHAPAETQRQAFEQLLALHPFDALSIGTRPDCLPPEGLDLLGRLARRIETWVELGVQTANDATLARIRRGHDWETSRRAVLDLAARGVSVAAHVILGLPGEGPAEFNRTAEALAALPVRAVKIHNLHIIRGSDLAREFAEHPFALMDEAAYAGVLIDFLRRLPAPVAIMRIATDTADADLVAPRWRMKKGQFLAHVTAEMTKRGVRQGDLVPAAAPRRRLLLHVCCGPCATHAVDTLRQAYDLTLFFSNSNIAPHEEYDRRRDEARKLAAHFGAPFVADAYDHAAWREAVRGLELEPERGARCRRCFEFNLQRAAEYARANGFDLFTTTLTISPHKSTTTIFDVGAACGPFLAVDLKKGDGFRRSLDLSRRLSLYRQDYCGCEFSQGAGHRPKNENAQRSSGETPPRGR